ncbi:MAG: glycosyltransferase [Deltaproteobacteria bacterium]|nr:glycosyltransferase [Deltaproteobacteria bacterium]
MSTLSPDKTQAWKTTVTHNITKSLKSLFKPDTILWIAPATMASFISKGKKLGYPIIFDPHALQSFYFSNKLILYTKYQRFLFKNLQALFLENTFFNQANLLIASSAIDATRIQKKSPKSKVQIIQNCLNTKQYGQLRKTLGHTLFFSGSLNDPSNIEGLNWFCNEIIPRLKAVLKTKMPRIIVAGSNPSLEFKSRLEASQIEVYANPNDIMPYLSEALLVFVPVHFGKGGRQKILQAMAAGRPVITTGKGAEGFSLTPMKDIYIADQTDTFTSAMIRLIRDHDFRQKMITNAIHTVEAHYDWRAVRPILKKLFEEFMT